MAGVFQSFATGSKAVGSAERVVELLRPDESRGFAAAAAPSNAPSLSPTEAAAVSGAAAAAAIEFRGVTFAYPTRPEVDVLRGRRLPKQVTLRQWTLSKIVSLERCAMTKS